MVGPFQAKLHQPGTAGLVVHSQDAFLLSFHVDVNMKEKICRRYGMFTP
jgi:hypothetical protein